MTDNLWDEDVLDEVTKFTETVGVHVQNKWLPGMLSQALCSRAKSASERRGKEQGSDEVPFARKAREEGIRFVGGKCDGALIVHNAFCISDDHFLSIRHISPRGGHITLSRPRTDFSLMTSCGDFCISIRLRVFPLQ